jgi:MOSC domain-containing protein YiiM
MKLISLNVGVPQEVQWQGRQVTTGIYKSAVVGPQMLAQLNLHGDAQADLSVHGGVHKAVYGYPVEHYDYWRAELPDTDFAWGMFGENFTTEGMLEEHLMIGERFRIGTAEVRVTEPRLPCYKLGIRFGRADMVRRFLTSRRTGFYFAVRQAGMVESGDEFERVHRPVDGITVADLTRVFAFDHDDLPTMHRIVEIEDLSDGWRDHFREKIHNHGVRRSHG